MIQDRVSLYVMKATKSIGKGKTDAVEASGLTDYVYSTFRGSERDCAFATTTREESFPHWRVKAIRS